jgi:hypothetical protein
MRKHAAPTLVAILLLLPVLYVGSYYALLADMSLWSLPQGSFKTPVYRVSGLWVKGFFWPMEQFDRKLRPDRGRDNVVDQTSPLPISALRWNPLTRRVN